VAKELVIEDGACASIATNIKIGTEATEWQDHFLYI
jgi:hypothetical protein